MESRGRGAWGSGPPQGAWSRGRGGRGGSGAEVVRDNNPPPGGVIGGNENRAPQGAWAARGRASQDQGGRGRAAPQERGRGGRGGGGPINNVVNGRGRGNGPRPEDQQQVQSTCPRPQTGGEGRRGARRPARTVAEVHDVVVSKPPECKKQGTTGTRLNLVANFFELEKKTDWCIFHYRVDYNPELELTKEKKRLLRPHGQSLGAHIFDGASLFVASRIAPDPLELFSLRENGERIQIIVTLVAQLDPTNSVYTQVFNIFVRKMMETMGLEEIGRNYYDPNAAFRLEEFRLELWPGFKTSMRHHENKTLLCVELTHKVLRMDSCLRIIKEGRGDRNKITAELLGAVVITHYNHKNYRIDDIQWNDTPNSTFEQNKERVSFIEYYKKRYNVTITDPTQPLLMSRPKKKDYHRGMTGPILLIPELCQMTGLSDSMRANFQLTKALTGRLAVDPEKRMKAIQSFILKTQANKSIQEEWRRWDLKLSSKPESLSGRQLPGEEILFGNGKKERIERDGDFTHMCKKYPMFQIVNLTNWVIIVPQYVKEAANRLFAMITELRGLGVRATNPNIIVIPQDGVPQYHNAIEEAVKTYSNIQIIIAILTPGRNNGDVYAVVKRRCVLEYGIASQCLLARNTENIGRFRSVCTKLMMQMNAKLGGAPWTLNNPLKEIMIIGFDVYHCGKNKGASVGAMVASTNREMSSYFSVTSHHNNREELASNLATNMTKCLHAYHSLNKTLPARIIMYRDGVGEGQLTYVYDTELEQIKTALKDVYESFGLWSSDPLKLSPKFSFLVVSKRINARIFQKSIENGAPVNPPAGTVVDDVITLPERFDFYLVAQKVAIGSVSPTSYNVLVDQQGLAADRLQQFTYKLCHMYYNWSGTVAVPSVCQYAHKLAYLTGIALKDSCNNRLTHYLYYL